MADAPRNGLYEPFVDAGIDGDRLEVLGEPFGPAGVAAVELPDGSTWQVDHLDPARLVALDVDATDPAGSRLLQAAFGGDGAMRVADQARHPDNDPGPRFDGRDAWGAGNPPAPEANAAGRLVLLADLAQDRSLDPLPRIFAIVELAVLAPRNPAGELLEPSLGPLVDLAQSLAADAEAVELLQIGPAGERRALVSRAFSEQYGHRAPAVLDLLAGRDRAMDGAVFGPAADQELDVARVAYAADAFELPSEPDDFLGVERVADALLEVTVARSDDERWVRVLRTDGLVLLAQAPLERGGLMDRAELLVPPDTLDHEIEVQIVEADQLINASRRPAELIRDAVRAGRAAASAERRGDIGLAMQRWDHCAELWAEAGDPERSRLAARRTTTAGGRFRGGTLLIDELDPYGDDEP